MSKSITTVPTSQTPLAKHYYNLNMIEVRSFRDFVKNVLKKKSRTTLLRWLDGTHQPSEAEQILIAEHLGIPQKKLFAKK